MYFKQKITSSCLGIDPGTYKCGWALIEYSNSNIKLINYGVINSRQQNNFDECILYIHYWLNEIINTYLPLNIAIETPFVGKNIATTIKLGQLVGALILTARINNLSIGNYKPMQIKKIVSSFGWANKTQISKMIEIILNLNHTLPIDAADAAAVAVSHILSTRQ